DYLGGFSATGVLAVHPYSFGFLRTTSTFRHRASYPCLAVSPRPAAVKRRQACYKLGAGGARGRGQAPDREGGRQAAPPPLTNYRFLGIDESSSSAHRPLRTSEKPQLGRI